MRILDDNSDITVGNIYRMKYGGVSEMEVYDLCTRIKKTVYYFEAVKSNTDWVKVGTKINYSRKRIRDLFDKVTEYNPIDDPEYFL